MELTNAQNVALWAFLMAMVFGAVAFKTNFCTMGAVSDWVNMGDKGRLRAWFLAIGIAILGAQGLQHLGLVDLGKSIYLTSNFGYTTFDGSMDIFVGLYKHKYSCAHFVGNTIQCSHHCQCFIR